MEIAVWHLNPEIRGTFCPHCGEKCYIQPEKERQAAYASVDHPDSRHIGVAAIRCPFCHEWAACYYPDPPDHVRSPAVRMPA